MSNKLKIILAIITSILVVSGSAIIFNSQRRNSQTQPSKVDSSSSSSTVSSSSSSQGSSVYISIPVIKTECNLPQSPNLVRTDNGCFELFFDFSDGSIFKNSSYSEIVNSNLLFDNTLNRGILTNIAKDYYTRISGQIISKSHKLFFTSSKKVNNSFQVSISVSDEDFFKNTNVVRIYSVRLNATYNFYKTENGIWTYSFKQFN